MQMTGEERIAAPRERVWEALNDPEVLRRCIPGCQSLENEGDDRLRATVEIKIGPIGARFTGAVTLSELDPPNGYTITGEGQGGMAGFAKGGARVRLTDEGGATLLAYTVDAQVGGRLAQLGGPIVDATAKQLAGKFFREFGQVVGGGAAAQAAPPASPSPARPAVAAPASAPVYPAALSTPAPASRSTILPAVAAVIVAAVAGFLLGRVPGGAGQDWMGLALGLVVVVVAAIGFELGRRTAAPAVVLDPELLARLAEGVRR